MCFEVREKGWLGSVGSLEKVGCGSGGGRIFGVQPLFGGQIWVAAFCWCEGRPMGHFVSLYRMPVQAMTIVKECLIMAGMSHGQNAQFPQWA